MRERGEFERIRDLLAALPAGAGRSVVIGPGDDAAVLRPEDGRDLVVTTDTFVEGRHFRRDLLDAAAAGRRLAAANLSDVAAMGARARWALVSCVAPRAVDPAWLHDVELACAHALAAEGAAVVGGNLSEAEGPCAFSVTLIGDVTRGAAWTRAGARAGDVLATTGALGHAGAALALALAASPPSFAPVPDWLAKRYLAPPSRIAAAAALARTGAVRACIDVSDGLAGDLGHLCEASGVGALLFEDGATADPALEQAARTLGVSVDALRFGPSDDYELLLALDPARWAECRAAAESAGARLTPIGQVIEERVLVLQREDGSREPVRGTGWSHFA
ncbi:MAG: thiamine-phosphate kinase [Candidatus Eisenbacteria bacterium]|uniref:Thiamine-monophosphate kinase n=1 Tax=Eiseniibacteriota bacterium TaxID=2212470 RepID=A0A933SFB0_UNCEI|nr:thiamine-phosphate kinase [Candidatus Eisenbacteria bacterium]